MGDPAHAAEDLAAEAWLVAAQRIGDFRGSPSDFAGWLFGIARNLDANAQRKAHRRDTFGADFDENPRWGSYDSLAADVAQEDWVRRTLADLPTREAEVVACLDVVGLDVAATARALGMTPTAVRVARHRGLKRLRSVLANQPPVARSANASR